MGGTADVKLKDGTHKSPDASYYDLTPAPEGSRETEEQAASIESNPTMAFEIGVSESAKKLAKDCARYVVASGGMINAALGAWIDCGSEAEGRVLKKVVVALWRLSGFESTDPTPDTLMEASRCEVKRIGRNGKQEDDRRAKSPGERFSFSSYDGKKILTWTASCTPELIYCKETGFKKTEGHISIYNYDMFQVTRQAPGWVSTAQFGEIQYADIYAWGSVRDQKAPLSKRKSLVQRPSGSPSHEAMIQATS
ncbi:hypothetical protein HYPSUDRAFT_832726 [Hypholoma sublateritium FD-334 SS-4]|uniref:Uncharacterized protein n=1 Tax=Hypholoma sublateritium (strain FD-334 SS-4) TaxID=945553 RepID=A0A0D2L0L6_HYPSF|nr:hypothetical protein HYPSUDRAFT_832726 [Hypholoma sublateritium FD-334 SS-4]